MNSKNGKFNFILSSLPKEAYFVLGMYVVWFIIFAILRVSFYALNSDLMESGYSFIDSFILGWRFDLVVSSYIVMAYFFILAAIIKPTSRSVAISVLAFFLSLFLLILVGEAEFYSAFETRLNYTLLEYFRDPKALIIFIWEGYPVFMYGILWVILVLILTAGQSFLFYALLREFPPYGETSLEVFKKGLVGLLVFLFIFAGTRGGLGGDPIGCDDADRLGSKFSSHLALNGAFTLGATIINNEAEGCISIKQVVPNIIILPSEDHSLSPVG